MVWKRTTAAPLFSKFQLMVLSAVLFGIGGKDGECKGRDARSLLGKILFPGVVESKATLRVQNALDDRVVDKLIVAFARDMVNLPTKEDREFVWMVRQEYPEGMKQFGDAIYNFELGKGLPSYKPVQIPWREPEPTKPKGEPKPEVKRGRPPLAKKPIVPESRRPWVDFEGNKGKPARQPPLVTSPRVVKPRSVFDEVQPGPAPYGYVACKPEAHDWQVFVSNPDKVLVTCLTCKIAGDILETSKGKGDAQERLAQLQEAMRAKNKVA